MPRTAGSAERRQLDLFDESSAALAGGGISIYRHPRAQRELQLGEHRVGYELRRARRRSIGFVVGLEGLSVAAPRWVAVGDIETALRGKAAWILRKLGEQRDRAARQVAAQVDWRAGTCLPYVGAPLRLALGAPGRTARLETDADGMSCLRLALPPDAAPAQVRDATLRWLQRRARELFDERCALYAPRLGVCPRRVGLSSARTRWGSASADGSVRFSWRLVHFELSIVDYVVAHELAHLRHMDHGPRFWDVVRSVYPDIEHARRRLRDEVLPVF